MFRFKFARFSKAMSWKMLRFTLLWSTPATTPTLTVLKSVNAFTFPRWTYYFPNSLQKNGYYSNVLSTWKDNRKKCFVNELLPLILIYTSNKTFKLSGSSLKSENNFFFSSDNANVPGVSSGERRATPRPLPFKQSHRWCWYSGL